MSYDRQKGNIYNALVTTNLDSSDIIGISMYLVYRFRKIWKNIVLEKQLSSWINIFDKPHTWHTNSKNSLHYYFFNFKFQSNVRFFVQNTIWMASWFCKGFACHLRWFMLIVCPPLFYSSIRTAFYHLLIIYIFIRYYVTLKSKLSI